MARPSARPEAALAGLGGLPADARAWNAIRDAAVLDGLDEPEAVREADRYIALAREGANAQRQAAAVAVWRDVAPFLAAAALLCALGAGIYSLVSFVPWGTYSYAGVQPGHVRDRAFVAVTDWYGHNDLPPQLRVSSVAKTSYLGRRAWKVSYRALDGKRVCAYVFSYNADGLRWDSNYGEVHEGSACA